MVTHSISPGYLLHSLLSGYQRHQWPIPEVPAGSTLAWRALTSPGDNFDHVLALIMFFESVTSIFKVNLGGNKWPGEEFVVVGLPQGVVVFICFC